MPKRKMPEPSTSEWLPTSTCSFSFRSTTVSTSFFEPLFSILPALSTNVSSVCVAVDSCPPALCSSSAPTSSVHQQGYGARLLLRFIGSLVFTMTRQNRSRSAATSTSAPQASLTSFLFEHSPSPFMPAASRHLINFDLSATSSGSCVTSPLVSVSPMTVSSLDVSSIAFMDLPQIPPAVATETVLKSPSLWCPATAQISWLLAVYDTETTTPSRARIMDLLVDLSSFGPVIYNNVYNWFQNRRARFRKQSAAQLNEATIHAPVIDENMPLLCSSNHRVEFSDLPNRAILNFEEGQSSSTVPPFLSTQCRSSIDSSAESSASECLMSTIRGLSAVCKSAWILPEAPPCEWCGAERFHRESTGICCCNGEVELLLPKLSDCLWEFFTSLSMPIVAHFRTHVRTYNNTFAFTSICMESDENFSYANNGVYTLRGVGSHTQLYFYDPDHEVQQRSAANPELDIACLQVLKDDTHLNAYAAFLRSLHYMPDLDDYNIVLRSHPSLDERVYNQPTTDHVDAIWKDGEDAPDFQSTDMCVYTVNGRSYPVNRLYACYDALNYPLLFPYGEPGWLLGIPRVMRTSHGGRGPRRRRRRYSVDPTSHATIESLLESEKQNYDDICNPRNTVSTREFYAYHMQIRKRNPRCNLRAGRLYQQFVIDMYLKINAQRLYYHKLDQQKRRND